MARIYVASSWRNAYYPEVVKRLREYGHEVYDFRNPPQGGRRIPRPAGARGAGNGRLSISLRWRCRS